MKNKIKAVSLFANVGVAEAYLKEIGIDVVVANEIDEKRSKFYEHLYPHTHMVCGDITNDLVRDGIVKECKEKGVDMVMATPPCQGMSIAGNMNPKDERNQLVYYAVDVILKLKPKFVFLENVPRTLVTEIEVNGETMLIPDYLKKVLGVEYNFNNETLVRAMNHGVPQMRQRNIFLLTRKDLKIKWEFPEEEPKVVTLKEAIGDLPSLDPLLKEGKEETLKLFPDYEKKRLAGLAVSKWHYPPKHNKMHVIWMMHTPSGESATNNPVYYPQKKNGERIVAHYNHYRRHNWDKPSRTITQNNGVISSLCCVHPGRPYVKDGETLYSDPRVFSIYELLIVSSLPTDWNIPDWADEAFIRHVIGEGIPPLLVKRIMENLLNKI
jgi:DNA (cytosine-5)-methyltransferase 1